MNLIFMALLKICFSFLLFRLIVIITNKLIARKYGMHTESKLTQFIRSMMYLLFSVGMWICIVCELAKNEAGMNAIQFYIVFVLIGIFCVVWCYFSWDEQKIFTKPRLATEDEKKKKRIVMYFLICVFSLLLGYQQIERVFDSTYQIPTLYTATNNSVVVAIIALDRVMNQVFDKKSKK